MSANKQVLDSLKNVSKNLSVLRDADYEDSSALPNAFDGDAWDVVNEAVENINSVIDQLEKK